MAGSFYQRYVPKSQPAPTQEEVIIHAPKPSFFTRYVPPGSAAPETAQPASTAQAEQPVPDEERPPKRRREERPKRPKKPKDESKSTEDDNDLSSADEKKHTRVREKFRRATNGVSEQKKSSEPIVEAEATQKDVAVSVKHGLDPIPQPMDIDEAEVNIEAPLPEWMSQPLRVKADERAKFENLGLEEKTVRGLKKRGHDEAFAIQSAVVPLMVEGKAQYGGDICVSASTGSGKTLAYVLPMVQNLHGWAEKRLRGLIVVPTRELVNQVRNEIELCATGLDLKVGIAVGNRTMAEEKAALMEKIQIKDPVRYHRKMNRTEREIIEDRMRNFGNPDSDDDSDLGYENAWKYVSAVDILVCTPGRLVDHIRSTRDFTLEHVRMLAIDEADRLLDQSFQQWVETVVPELEYMSDPGELVTQWRRSHHFRPRRELQKIILSATMTKDISQLLSLKLKNPKWVVLEGQGQAEEDRTAAESYELPTGLRETAVPLGLKDEKPLVLIRLIDELLSSEPTTNPGSRISSGGPGLKNGGINSRNDDTSSDGSEDTSDSDSESSSSEAKSYMSASEDDTTSSDNSTSSSGSDSETTSTAATKQPHYATRGVLIFTNTNESALRLSRLLTLLRPSLKEALGTLTKSTGSALTRRLLSSFRTGKLTVIVASDRASRGLDIRHLATVVNYDMPTSLMSYVHRVGRTARAGQRGEALTLVAHHEARWFWRSIGRAEGVVRASKVGRREGLGREVTEETKEKYAQALARLGEEARGAK